MIIQPRILNSTAILIVITCAHTVLAQTQVNWTVPSGNWTIPGNWSTGIVPDTNFDELANISNGGTAIVKSSALGRDRSCWASRRVTWAH
jgi:hypothetical protein